MREVLWSPRAVLTVAGLLLDCTLTFYTSTADYLALFDKDHGVEEWFCWHMPGCALLSRLVFRRMSETRSAHGRMTDKVWR